MGQRGFFDVERRLEAISANGDPLETIKNLPWPSATVNVRLAAALASADMWTLSRTRHRRI